MARKKKVVEPVVEDAPVVDPVTDPGLPSVLVGSIHDSIPDVVFSDVNFMRVADEQTLLNTTLRANTFIFVGSAGALLIASKDSLTVSGTIQKLVADGSLRALQLAP